MRNGTLKSLEDVIEFYNRGGDVRENLGSPIQSLQLTRMEKNDLLEFLKTFKGEDILVTLPRLPTTRTQRGQHVKKWYSLSMKEKNSYISGLKELVLHTFIHEKVKVVLFGSRGRGQASSFSDVDIGIIPKGNEKLNGKISLLREKIEESNLPYHVDIVNFAEVSSEFRKEALSRIIVWKE